MSRFTEDGDVVTCPKAEKAPKARHWSSSVPYRSSRREDERPLRLRLVEVVLERDGHRCRAERSVPQVRCEGELDVHEIIPRSAWRDGYLVLWNCVSVCRKHHDWIGDHPTEAHRLGLHGWSWEAPTRRRYLPDHPRGGVHQRA